MNNFEVGDIVARKSYGGDTYFRITDIVKNQKGHPVYILRGLLQRIEADCVAADLTKHDQRDVFDRISQEVDDFKRQASACVTRFKAPTFRFPVFARFRTQTGKILHIDADERFMGMCLDHYSEINLKAVGKSLEVERQPENVRGLLERYKPDILVVTGHDGLKKGSGNLHSMDNYKNSRYYVESVKQARKYEPNPDKLFIFAGACQSYYEAIMEAGANFASAPDRVFINALDPAFVSEKVGLTDSRYFVTPAEVSKITKSGKAGIWGVNSRGHMTRV